MKKSSVLENTPIAYRYFDSPKSSGDSIPKLVKYEIIKVTPKGFKIKDHINGSVRQVFLRSCTQYAHETKIHALESYRNRKIKQRLILEQQLKVNKEHFNNINIIRIGVDHV